MNERLEELSDKVRKGIPVDFSEALEVIEYQEMLREERNNLSIWKRIYRDSCAGCGQAPLETKDMSEPSSDQAATEVAGQHERLVIYMERYDKDAKWREAWNGLANNIEVCRAKYPLQKQQEYIEHRAHLANMRIAKLMRDFDAGI